MKDVFLIKRDFAKVIRLFPFLPLAAQVNAQFVFAVGSATSYSLSSGNTPRYYYEVSGVGRIFKATSGTSSISLTTISAACEGSSTVAFPLSSGTFVFQTYNAISDIAIYGEPTGNRTLTSVATGLTIGTYTAITYTNPISTMGTSGTCGEMQIVPTSTIPANSYIQVTFSGNVNISTIKLTLPRVSTPTVSSATNITSSGFTANWSTVTNATGYIVNVYNSNTSTLVGTYTASGQSVSSYAVTGLSSNTNYYYTVTAVGDGASYTNSYASSSVSFRTLNTSKQITSFTLLGATGTIDQIALTITVAVPYSSTLPGSYTPTVTVSDSAKLVTTGAQTFQLSTPTSYTVKAEDGSTQTYSVYVTKAPASTACNITAFNFGITKESDVISQTDTTITVTVPKATTVTSLTPTTLTISSLASVTSPTFPVDFSSTVSIVVLAEDGVTSKTYKVTVIQDSVAPVLTATSPQNGATGVSLAGLIKLTYNDYVVLGSGTITLTNTSTATSVTLTPKTMSPSGTITVSVPFSSLSSLTTYKLTISAGAFTDLYGNATADTVITFTTADGVLRSLPYKSSMDADSYSVPAFITGGNGYDATATTGSCKSSSTGAYVLVKSSSTPGTDSLIITVDPSLGVGQVKVGVAAPGSGRTVTLSNNANTNTASVTIPAANYAVCDSSAYATMTVEGYPSKIYIVLTSTSEGQKAYVFSIEITKHGTSIDTSSDGDSRWNSMKGCN